MESFNVKSALDALCELEHLHNNPIKIDDARMHYTYLDTMGLEVIEDVEKKKNHDPYKHGIQILEYVLRMCENTGLNGLEKYAIACASKWHDIGKKYIPSSVLNKKEPLTHDDWGFIRQHPLDSYKMISFFPDSTDISRYSDRLAFSYTGLLTKHHHEMYDGTGYPEGLSGIEIPKGSRLIKVVDSFCAMTHDRGYNHDRVLDIRQAVEEIRRCKGTQFDPDLAENFIDILKLLKKI